MRPPARARGAVRCPPRQGPRPKAARAAEGPGLGPEGLLHPSPLHSHPASVRPSESWGVSPAGHLFGAESPTVCPWGRTLGQRHPLPGHRGLAVLSPRMENLPRAGAARHGWPQSERLGCGDVGAIMGSSRRAGDRARYRGPQWLRLILRKDRWPRPRRVFRVAAPRPLTPKDPGAATATSSQSAERPSSRPSLGPSPRPGAPFLVLRTRLPSRKVAHTKPHRPICSRG